MANEYKLSHTAAEIDEKLGAIEGIQLKVDEELSVIGSIQSQIDIDSIANTRQNLNYLGQNPITSIEEDTPANWIALGTGIAFINGNGQLNNQPTPYGYVENYTDGVYIYQAIHSLNGLSTVWSRSGTKAKWYDNSANWVKQIDENNLLNMVYPVGAVYISYESTSPAELFGGTWTAITGVFPYFNAGTETGGSNTHTLTTAQMPAHTHTWQVEYSGGGSTGYYVDLLSGVSGPQNMSTGSTGGGSSHNNMPAYQTFYAWRRTA